MGELHTLIGQHGRVPAKRLVPPGDVKLVDLAASVLWRRSMERAYVTSGFGDATLPHRADQAEHSYRFENKAGTTIVEPGFFIDGDGNRIRTGIPFGPRARLILLFLQTEAIRQQSPEVCYRSTMNAWLERMQIQPGGKTYAAFREQQRRIAACRVTMLSATEPGQNFVRQPIVEGPLDLFANKFDCQDELRPVVINRHIFDLWIRDPVPIWEGAAMRLSSQSLAIDVYCWLASTLCKLKAPITIGWSVVHRMYGSSYSLVRHFKPRFLDCVKMALAVYPEAQVELDSELGLRLFPSPSPV